VSHSTWFAQPKLWIAAYSEFDFSLPFSGLTCHRHLWSLRLLFIMPSSFDYETMLLFRLQPVLFASSTTPCLSNLRSTLLIGWSKSQLPYPRWRNYLPRTSNSSHPLIFSSSRPLSSPQRIPACGLIHSLGTLLITSVPVTITDTVNLIWDERRSQICLESRLGAV